MVVEIAGERYDAVGPQLGAVRGAPSESVEPDAAAQQKCSAQCDITASDQQYPDHVPALRQQAHRAPYGTRYRNRTCRNHWTANVSK